MIIPKRPFIMFLSFFIQKYRCSKNAGDRLRPVKTTEIKLTILIIIYFTIYVYVIIANSEVLRNKRALQNKLTQYFACEALGNDAEDCSNNVLKSFLSSSIASAISFNLLITYPVFFLFVFMIDYHSCFRLWNKLSQTTVSSTQDHSS